MPILFDFNSDTGVKTLYDYDPLTDQYALTYEQDVSGFLDRMNDMRKKTDYSDKGIKEEWWHYCSIPPVVEMELMKKNLSLSRKDDFKEILKEINANYPYLKATDKKHA